jgi:hypothetical protein
MTSRHPRRSICWEHRRQGRAVSSGARAGHAVIISGSARACSCDGPQQKRMAARRPEHFLDCVTASDKLLRITSDQSPPKMLRCRYSGQYSPPSVFGATPSAPFGNHSFTQRHGQKGFRTRGKQGERFTGTHTVTKLFWLPGCNLLA